MANSDAVYFKVPADGADTQAAAQHETSSRVSRVGNRVLIGGSCLMLLTFMAVFTTWSPTLQGTSVAESTQSTSLFGMPASLRSANKASPMQMRAHMLPGSGPWKELALAGIEASQGCGRNVAAKAKVKALWANMDSASKDLIVRAEQTVQTKFGDLQSMKDLKAGQTGPMGFFDPLGLTANLDAGKILFYREAELKHGRVCMLASLGFLVGENFHPLFGGDIDVPSYVAWQAIPIQAFWVAIAAAVAIPEVGYSIPTFKDPVTDKVYKDQDTFSIDATLDRVPGDLGYDPLGIKPKDPAAFLEMQNKELNNGRLAMIGIAGMVAQELVSGEKIFH